MTAEIQSRRRLGLTATLVREDGREGDVFSLIGPKRYDAPWRDVEAQGWIAPALCTEVRVTLTDEERTAYALAEAEGRYRVGATARSKLVVAQQLCAEAVERSEPTLVIGQYLDQLDELSQLLGVPTITGKTPTRERSGFTTPFVAGGSGCWSFRKWPTSPSTSPRRRWRSRCRGRSEADRKKRSVWGESCVPKRRTPSPLLRHRVP